MSSADILSRLRRFLLIFSVLLLGGTTVELLMVNHVGDAVQLIPFVLCGLGAAAALVALFRPRRATLLILRACMTLTVTGSLFGVYQHFENNLAFEREINPNAPAWDALLTALGGANPLLAPGILAVAAILALAATYHHPALGGEEQST